MDGLPAWGNPHLGFGTMDSNEIYVLLDYRGAPSDRQWAFMRKLKQHLLDSGYFVSDEGARDVDDGGTHLQMGPLFFKDTDHENLATTFESAVVTTHQELIDLRQTAQARRMASFKGEVRDALAQTDLPADRGDATLERIINSAEKNFGKRKGRQ